jgi:hypothetical protein
MTRYLILAVVAVVAYLWYTAKPKGQTLIIARSPTPQSFAAVGQQRQLIYQSAVKPSADGTYSRLGYTTAAPDTSSSNYIPTENPNWSNYRDVESSRPSSTTQDYYLQNSEEVSAGEMGENP